MRGSFELKIALGNAAMQTETNLRDAILDVGWKVGDGAVEGIVRDRNGNTVGQFMLAEKED